MLRLLVIILAATLATAATAPAQTAPVVDRSIRPEIRPGGFSMAEPRAETPAMAPAAPTAAGFRRWIAGFRPRALAQGIPGAVFDRAFRGARFDPAIVERDRNQNEFSRAIWDYLDSAVSTARIRGGQEAVRRHGRTLAAVEARYGVEKEIVAAIWGLESSYGAVKGKTPIIGALATLAYDTRRSAFFEEQLVDALKILQSGVIGPEQMKGSWAGAMGHTQFMPGSYLRFAQDFDGDGRRDIWGDDPADALASTAAYLARNGWTRGQPWGLEVVLPDDFDYMASSERVKKPVSEWMAMGIRDTSGRPVPEHGASSILLPAGHRGPAFMIFENFHVLETYNTADAYVIGVGHLADRIAGGGPIAHEWPRGDRPLTYPERIELQKLLTAAGFDTEGIDGIVGPNTIAAVKAWQAATGLVPDGYAPPRLLARLR